MLADRWLSKDLPHSLVDELELKILAGRTKRHLLLLIPGTHGLEAKGAPREQTLLPRNPPLFWGML